MLELTEKEIDRISSDIDQQGLTYTLLKDELLDHICCDIEAEMENGLTFNEAYRKVKGRMGKKRIRQIQDETLYLISKKYRRMKKLMYVLGVAVPIMIMAALIFKLMHWPGAGVLISGALFTAAIFFLPVFVMVRIRDTRRQDEPVPLGLYITGMISGMMTIVGALFKLQHMPGSGVLLTLGLGSLALVFVPMFVIVQMREAQKKNKPINKVQYYGGMIAGVLFILGALFKTMHWPGGGIGFITSWFLVAVLLLPMLALNQLKQKGNRINNFFTIVVVISFIAILLMAWFRSRPRNVLEGFFFPENSMTINASYLSNQSNKFMNSAILVDSVKINEQMETIRNHADQVCDYIQYLKTEMIPYLTEKNDTAIDSEGNIDLTKVSSIANEYIPYEIIVMGEDNRLYKFLKSFREDALALTTNQDLKLYIDSQLDLTLPEGEGDEYWAKQYFSGPFLQTATYLSMYQSIVRMIEFECLRELASGMEE